MSEVEKKSVLSKINFGWKNVAIIVVAIGLIFSLFSTSKNISIVKDGTMEFNKSITIGQAFNSWEICDDRSWSEFTTDDGISIVEFKCDATYFNKDILETVNELITKEDAKMLDIKNLDFEKVETTFQFTINKDDTFKLDNTKSVIIYTDGKQLSLANDALMELKNVYINERFRFYEVTSSEMASQLGLALVMMKKQAK